MPTAVEHRPGDRLNGIHPNVGNKHHPEKEKHWEGKGRQGGGLNGPGCRRVIDQADPPSLFICILDWVRMYTWAGVPEGVRWDGWGIIFPLQQTTLC